MDFRNKLDNDTLSQILMSLHEKAKGYFRFYKRSIILKFCSCQCNRGSMKVTKIAPILEKNNFYKVSFSRVFRRKRKTYNGGSKVRKWCKDTLKLPRNKIRITVTSKKTVKVRLGFILNRNHEASLEDSTPIEGFLSVWGFNGELWWFMVDTGGYGDGEEAWDVGNGFGRRKEKEMVFFQGYTNHKGWNTQVLLLSEKEAFLTRQTS